MASEGYHEPYEKLPSDIRDMHRAIRSLMEELEAVDWYYQRAAVTGEEALKRILLHNAHEEIEHAMMVLEWIRRRDKAFDANMREYLFSEGDIVEAEASVTGEKVPGDLTPREEGGQGGGRGGGPSGGPRGAGGADADLDSLTRRPRRTLGSLRDQGRGR